MQSKSSATAQKRSSAESDSSVSSMQSSQLMQLFEDELKDILWAEKALTKAIPKMQKNATSQDLMDALEAHLEETYQHVERLEEVFTEIGKKAVSKKCEAMDGLIKEGTEIMESCEKGSMRDAGIIAAGQKIEHYEIATYGTLRQFAETLGLKKSVSLLASTLEEEKAADEKLSEVATSAINIDASNTKSKK